jgi:hypothetical protein
MDDCSDSSLGWFDIREKLDRSKINHSQLVVVNIDTLVYSRQKLHLWIELFFVCVDHTYSKPYSDHHSP